MPTLLQTLNILMAEAFGAAGVDGAHAIVLPSQRPDLGQVSMQRSPSGCQGGQGQSTRPGRADPGPAAREAGLARIWSLAGPGFI